MGLFGCGRHKWIDVNRYFVLPVDREIHGASIEHLRNLLTGYTVIELRCTKCGDLKSKILSGDATDDRRVPDYVPKDI